MSESLPAARDLRALAEAAEAAMPSPWWYDGRDILHHGKGTHVIRVVVPVDETWHKDLAIPDSVLAFIAACNPATIIGMVERIRALEAALHCMIPPPNAGGLHEREMREIAIDLVGGSA